ncbi:hypothetical protein RvY_06207-1 [Ramazzottius varieornatus]|uniref:ornithine decarboxylase n=1 Tax=Ramazzottius varieornatus TaxID=947166 RepID=A0A1D1V6J5_RAMVA|nr:hypothetical protein RvY_06207-1 [Ramazzottius varieornatus]
MRLDETVDTCMFTSPLAQETLLAGEVALTVHTFDPANTSIERCVDQYIQYSDSLGIDDAFNIVDLGDVIRKCHLWREKLPRVEPFYAIKCNPDMGILQTLANMGIGFDCASKEEIASVLRLGVCPDRIVFAHTCKPKSHIIYAAQQQVKLTTFDNEPELHKIKRLYPAAQLLLRIRADDPMAVVNLGCKFGAHLPEAKRLLAIAQDLALNVIGVSFHVGSVCANPAAYAQAIAWSREVFDHAETLGMKLKVLDLGGGYPGHKGDPINFQQVVDEVKPALDKHFPPGCGVRLIAEPGRFFVASAMTLCLNITAKRVIEAEQRALNVEGPEFMYYVNDGVYGSFNCMEKDKAVIELKVPPQAGLSATLHCASLWGPTCDGLDCITASYYLPQMDIGHWLYLEDMGAYTNSASSGFNGFARPTMVYVAAQQDFAQVRPTSKPLAALAGPAAASNDGLPLDERYIVNERSLLRAGAFLRDQYIVNERSVLRAGVFKRKTKCT